MTSLFEAGVPAMINHVNSYDARVAMMFLTCICPYSEANYTSFPCLFQKDTTPAGTDFVTFPMTSVDVARKIIGILDWIRE